jgi:DNA repair exonuclease SbcCD ATPase subunit
MANESQDLVFKLRADTSNAEQGMAKVTRLTDDLKITTEKTSGALREFGGQLKQARDLSDVAGMATKALGQVLGASLGGTAVLVAGKALIDAFNTVQTAVKETEGKVKDAFKEIDKAGLPKTFEESANQANKLASAADEVTKKVKEIDSNFLQKFIAGITGARDKMEELALSTQKAAQERIKLGVQTAIADEQFQSGLSEKDKKLNDLFKSYQAKADAISASMLAAGASPEEVKKVVDEIYNAHTTARNAMLNDFALKEQKVAEENATKETDLRRANDMAEFDLQQKSQNTLFENERARLNDQIQTRLKAADEEAKRREESAKRLEEFQDKLVALAEKRAALEEKIAAINEQMSAKQADLAKQGAGLGGTMRGAGQQATSYEVGFGKSVDKATQAAQRADAQTARNNLQDKILLDQKGISPSQLAGMTKAEKNALVSPESVQIAQKDIAIRDAQNKVIKEGTKSLEEIQKKYDSTNEQLDSNIKTSKNLEEAYMELQDSTDSSSDAVDSFTDSVDTASEAVSSGGGGGGGGGGGKTLSDVYQVLNDTLIELKTYAHAA